MLFTLKLDLMNLMKAGSKTGFHGKWQFQTEISPSADFIKARVEHSPVAISFEVDTDFHELKKVSKKKGATCVLRI